MDLKDITVGMKVVPIKKTAGPTSWEDAKQFYSKDFRGRGYLTVKSIMTENEQAYFKAELVLEGLDGGLNFNACDVVPYSEGITKILHSNDDEQKLLDIIISLQ